MRFDLNNYIIDLRNINCDKILSDWEWLIGPKKKLIYISNTGSFFFIDGFGHFYWVDSEDASMERIADNIDEFSIEIEDEEDIEEWFKPKLVNELQKRGLHLLKNQIYAPKALSYSETEHLIDCFVIKDVEEHFESNGKFLKQIKGW